MWGQSIDYQCIHFTKDRQYWAWNLLWLSPDPGWWTNGGDGQASVVRTGNLISNANYSACQKFKRFMLCYFGKFARWMHILICSYVISCAVCVLLFRRVIFNPCLLHRRCSSNSNPGLRYVQYRKWIYIHNLYTQVYCDNEVDAYFSLCRDEINWSP